jgi:hypothetical protein
VSSERLFARLGRNSIEQCHADDGAAGSNVLDFIGRATCQIAQQLCFSARRQQGVLACPQSSGHCCRPVLESPRRLWHMAEGRDTFTARQAPVAP